MTRTARALCATALAAWLAACGQRGPLSLPEPEPPPPAAEAGTTDGDDEADDDER